ncbi:DUF3068 domain-containing protein [Corynebacterium sp. P5875]|uniref:DUF3068 domain-containing protein n=1 Tax=Corynebacterium antarcticum TaxID=2800405 RepID=A0A9Q4GNE6_9CORY|nr:DUF3068 domain-containing protein [Corynebacterium antarcticum]MCX7538751.1 DUF3068 domain-containing protein [Corynebacterium antarcticum]
MTSRVSGFTALTLGVALVAVAVLLPSFLLPRLKVIPLDAGGKTVTREVDATLLDSRAFGSREVLPEHAANPVCEGDEVPVSCFIGHATPVHGNRSISVVEPADADVVTLRAGNVLMRTDRPEPDNIISATVDTITLNRRTALPVEEPVSSFHATSPRLGLDDMRNGFTREGVQYQFPFDSDARSYPYFDTTAQEAQPIDFVDEEVLSGHGEVKVMRYHQQVGPVNMFTAISGVFNLDGEVSEHEKASLNALRMTTPARDWYTPAELEERGLAPDERVTMTRYYANDRTVWVEPSTGVIVHGREYLNYFFARDDDEARTMAQARFDDPDAAVNPNRTALAMTAEWNDATQDRQWAKALDGRSKLNLLGSVGWSVGIAGALLILLGVWLLRRRPRSRP